MFACERLVLLVVLKHDSEVAVVIHMQQGERVAVMNQVPHEPRDPAALKVEPRDPAAVRVEMFVFRCEVVPW